jgi:predicted nuclease of predicted toxin-antitoxin system
VLLDANLSPKIVTALIDAGHEVVHVVDLDLLTASDPDILDRAAADSCIVVTADTDFPELLAKRKASAPSVVLLRGVADLRPDDHAALLVANLPAVSEDLEIGAIASIDPTRVRVRRLPIE